MDPQDAASRVDRLRSFRVRPMPDQHAGAMFEATGRELARQERKLAGIAEAWESICPPEHLGLTEIQGISRGVLTIGVADASTRYELDRLLKSGAQKNLVRLCPMTVRRVKLVAAQIDTHEG
ncbi:MAG: DciA family protein [Planctomycetota bacterium]